MPPLIIPSQKLHDEEAAVPPPHLDSGTETNSPASTTIPQDEKTIKGISLAHHPSAETLAVQPGTVGLPEEKEESFLVGWDGPDDLENPLVRRGQLQVMTRFDSLSILNLKYFVFRIGLESNDGI